MARSGKWIPIPNADHRLIHPHRTYYQPRWNLLAFHTPKAQYYSLQQAASIAITRLLHHNLIWTLMSWHPNHF